ncbi:MAG: hypothetical protein IPH52_11380 [Leptospiraceae bacterium]|nr:hypothetical protein [Leptospiraceae bacterium]MBK7055635.1 hypothetical protein [Leptospiraceae bacterium]
MKKTNLKFNKISLQNKALVICISGLLSFTTLESQEKNLKEEIHIPFPENITIEESILLERKKAKNTSPQIKEQTKKSLSIPFPPDPDSKEPVIEFKKIESEKSLTEDKKNESGANAELPLEKLIVFPKIDLPNPVQVEPKKLEEVIPAAKDSKPPVVIKEEVKTPTPVEVKKESKPEKIEVKTETKPTNEIGKALVGKEKQEVTKPSKTPNSKLDLKGQYGVEDTSNKSPTKEVKAKDPNAKKEKAVETTPTIIPDTKLPNIDKPSSKKGKDKKQADETAAPFERSKYYLNRNDKPSATPELNAATSGDGEISNLAKMDQIRLLALDRKKNEAKNVIEGISDPEFRFKGLYELAVGLENSAKGDKKLKEEAIPFHLSIITEAPKTNAILPKSLWALSHLLYTIGDHTPALDHLSNIILNHSNSEFADDAIYLSGRIYEESTSIRNLTRAKKYYELFLKNRDKPHFKNSQYLNFVKSRLELLEN